MTASGFMVFAEATAFRIAPHASINGIMRRTLANARMSPVLDCLIVGLAVASAAAEQELLV